WFLPWRMARAVDRPSAACGDLTSTPMDCSRKRTSLLPTPIWAASSSTRIFAMNCVLDSLFSDGRFLRRLFLRSVGALLAGGFFRRRLFLALSGLLGGFAGPPLGGARLLEFPRGRDDLLGRLLADAFDLGKLRGRLIEEIAERRDAGFDKLLGGLLADARDLGHRHLSLPRGLQHPR